MVGLDGNIRLFFIENNSNLFEINLNPSFGIFIQDNFALGGSLAIEYQRMRGSSGTAFSLLPFGRYYFGKPDSYQFFVEAGLGLVLQGNNFRSDNDTGLRYQLGPGMAFFLSDNISLDLQLLFDRIGGDFDTNQLGLFFGFQIYLGGGKE